MYKESLTDTHFHLELTDDIEAILKRAQDNNVKNFIISGCDLKGIKDSLEISQEYKNIYLTIGLHPSEIADFKEDTISYLEQLIKENPKIIGIGEIGLDYYHDKDHKKEQQIMFEAQLQLALKLQLPVVIHTRDAFHDTYEILKKYPLRGVIHCFSGSKENAKSYLALGFYLGIGGVSTFKNTNLKETLKEIPLSSLVLETDSPYLTPEPIRREVNEPKNIKLIALNLAEIKNLPLEVVTKETTANVMQLYNLK